MRLKSFNSGVVDMLLTASLWLGCAVGFLPEVVAQDALRVRQVAIIGRFYFPRLPNPLREP